MYDRGIVVPEDSSVVVWFKASTWVERPRGRVHRRVLTPGAARSPFDLIDQGEVTDRQCLLVSRLIRSRIRVGFKRCRLVTTCLVAQRRHPEVGLTLPALPSAHNVDSTPSLALLSVACRPISTAEAERKLLKSR